MANKDEITEKLKIGQEILDEEYINRYTGLIDIAYKIGALFIIFIGFGTMLSYVNSNNIFSLAGGIFLLIIGLPACYLLSNFIAFKVAEARLAKLDSERMLNR